MSEDEQKIIISERLRCLLELKGINASLKIILLALKNLRFKKEQKRFYEEEEERLEKMKNESNSEEEKLAAHFMQIFKRSFTG